MYEYGEKFSSKAITLLCQTMSEEEQAKLDFMPFYYIKSDCKVIEELETFLNNKNNTFFKRGIPEKFTTTIASNNEIPNHIRNKAFEIGYNQREEVEKILKENGYKNIYSRKDLGGNDRIVVGQI